MWTNRRTPAFRAASIMLAVPPAFTASKSARDRALIDPARWMTASAPAHSFTSVSGRSRAPSTQQISSSGGSGAGGGAVHPADRGPGGLPAAGERPDVVTVSQSEPKQVGADEAGSAGDGEG